jgi:hypothetical protein
MLTDNNELLASGVVTLPELPELAKSMGQKRYTKLKAKCSLQNFSRTITSAYRILQKSEIHL